MVPSFGLFEFEPAHKAFVSSEDQERAGYLSEVVLHSTEFGAGNYTESSVRRKDMAAAPMFNPF